MALRGQLLFLLLFLNTAAVMADRQPIDVRVSTLEALADMTGNLPDLARGALIEAKFHELFPGRTLSGKESDAELNDLFVASDIVAFYEPSIEATKRLMDIDSALSARGKLSADRGQEVVGALIKARMFDEVHIYQHLNPDVVGEVMPEVISAKELDRSLPSAFDVTGNGLLRRQVVSKAPFQIIVVAHPLCHFSVQASGDIAQNEKIARIFAEHSIWIAPEERKLRLDVFREWNAHHPRQPMGLVYRRSEWGGFDGWSTPTFYFLKDGKVVTWFDGWPKDGNWALLTEGLDRIGALKADKAN